MGDKFVLAKIPVVVGEDTTQVLIDQVFGLSEPAIKVTDVHTEVRNITTHIVPDKVIVQAVVHKQVFYVTEENLVRHESEELPLSTVIVIRGARPGMHAQHQLTVEKPVFFRLLDAASLEQKVVVKVFVKVTEEQQLFIKALPKDKFEAASSVESTLLATQLASGLAKFQVALAKGDRETCMQYLDAAAAAMGRLKGTLLCGPGADLFTRIVEELKKNL